MAASQFYPSVPVESVPRQRQKNGGAFSQGNYSSGQPWSVKVDRVGDLLSTQLALAGSVNTGDTPGTPTARVRNPASLLGNIKVLVNGKEEFSGMADMLLARAQWRRGRNAQLQSAPLLSTDLDDASASYDFSAQLPFDFALGAAGVPYHPGTLFSQDTPDIEISGTWGTVSDLMTSPGATQAVAGASLTLTKDFARLKRGGVGGLTPQQAAMGWGHFRVTQPGGSDVTSTGVASFSKDIPGGRAYASIIIRAQAGSVPDASDVPFQTSGGYIRIKRGSDILFEQSLAECIANTQQGFPTSFDRTGLIVVDMLRAYLPGEQAILSRVLLSPNGQPLTVEVDATTTTGAHIDILTEEYLDPVSSAAQRYGR